MFLKRVCKYSSIVAFFVLFFNAKQAFAVDDSFLLFDEATSGNVLYTEWKAVVDIIKVVEPNSQTAHLIEEFKRLYDQTLVKRFERLEKEPFEQVFSPEAQASFFWLLERFNGMIEATLDFSKDLSIIDERALLCIYNLNNLFLEKKPKTVQSRTADVLKKLKRIAKKRPFVTAALSTSALLLALLGGTYILEKRERNDDDDIEPDGTDGSSSLSLDNTDKHIFNKKVFRQQTNDCGYGAIFVTSQRLQDKPGVVKDQAAYATFLENQRTVIREYRTKKLKGFMESDAKKEAEVQAWLSTNPVYKAQTFFNKAALPHWAVLTKLAGSAQTEALHLTFYKAKAGAAFSEAHYTTWLLDANNRMVFRFLKNVDGIRVALGGGVIDYLKTHAERIATTGFTDDDTKYILKTCNSDDVSAEELEDVLLVSLGLQDKVVVFGDPRELSIDTNCYNQQPILRNKGLANGGKSLIDKIKAYRQGQRTGVLLRLDKFHWISMIFDHKNGKPYAYTMDTLGSNYSQAALPHQVFDLFEKGDLAVECITSVLEQPLESAWRQIGFNQDVPTCNNEAALSSVTWFIIFALYGNRGKEEPRRSYFDDKGPVFKSMCEKMEKVYAKIVKDIATPEKVMISISKKATLNSSLFGASLSSADLIVNLSKGDPRYADFVHIPCNMQEHNTFEKFVNFIKQQPKVKELITGGA